MTSRTGRRAGVVVFVTVLLTAVGTATASAADGHAVTLADAQGGGLLGPFTSIKTSDGLPVSSYELSGGGYGLADTSMRFLMGGLFALARTVTGFACWIVDWVYQFPVISSLSSTAQHIADAYQQHIVTPLGLAGVFTAWAFAFGLYMVARGRAARGFGEIILTLLIAALAATSLVRPDVVLGHDGPLQQVQRAALEVARITTQANNGAASVNPCDSVLSPDNPSCRSSDATVVPNNQRKKACASLDGPARDVCLFGDRSAASQVSKPIMRTLSDVLIVQPYQLLQYGRVISKSSPLYNDYVAEVAAGDRDPSAHPCDMLDDKAGDLCRQRSRDNVDRCSDAPGKPMQDLCEQKTRKEGLLKGHGSEGKAATAYNSDVSWDRVFGALFVLFAALIMALVVLAMAFAMIAAQFSCVLAAAATCVVFMWALLPGPNRMVLWRWVGVFASSSVVLFGISDFIPLFGIAARTLLSSGENQLIERLVLLDGLAVTALVMHRRMVAKGSNLGHAIAARMRFAKVGGTHMMGDQAAGMGMALASMGIGGGGGGSGYGSAAQISLARSGNSSAHAAFAQRRAKLASGMAALSDGSGLPSNPLAALGEARAEARRAIAPLSVPLRAAQLAWVGPPRNGRSGQGPPAGGGSSGDPLGRGAKARWVVDGATGEVMSHPDQGVKPIGERLRARISRTRGGRVLLGVSRLAWHTTAGAPAAWTRLRRKKSDLTQEMDRQLNHYVEVRERWGRDSRAGLGDAATAARRPYERAMDPLRRANRLRQWIEPDNSSLRGSRPSGSLPPPDAATPSEADIRVRRRPRDEGGRT